MTATARWLAATLALYGAAAWLRPAGPGAGVEPLRAVARPLLLPFLWRGLREARLHEDPAALAARGQRLLALLPMWVDGHILFAGELAMAASQRAADPDVAADRLLAALALLEAAADAAPARAATYLAAMSSFVSIRRRQSPELGDRIRDRLGIDAELLADGYLARAEAATPGTGVREQRTFLLTSVIAGAIRTGDVERARATIGTMLERLAGVRDRALVERYTVALRRADRFLAGDPEIDLASLTAEPLLDEIAQALATRPEHRGRTGGR